MQKKNNLYELISTSNSRQTFEVSIENIFHELRRIVWVTASRLRLIVREGVKIDGVV